MWERSYRQEEGGSRSGETITKTRVREKNAARKTAFVWRFEEPSF